MERPLVLALLLAATGSATSYLLITTMHRWPAWTIFPSMLIAVLAMAATATGAGLLVVLMLQPIIELKDDLGWDEEPLASMGLPHSLQRKCEQLGYWTCESAVAAMEKGTFPWTELEYDERMQVERAMNYWKATQASNS